MKLKYLTLGALIAANSAVAFDVCGLHEQFIEQPYISDRINLSAFRDRQPNKQRSDLFSLTEQSVLLSKHKDVSNVLVRVGHYNDGSAHYPGHRIDPTLFLSIADDVVVLNGRFTTSGSDADNADKQLTDLLMEEASVSKAYPRTKLDEFQKQKGLTLPKSSDEFVCGWAKEKLDSDGNRIITPHSTPASQTYIIPLAVWEEFFERSGTAHFINIPAVY